MFPRIFIIAHFFDLSRLLHKKAECGEGSDSISVTKEADDGNQNRNVRQKKSEAASGTTAHSLPPNGGEGSDSISGQKRERAPVWGCAFSLEQMTGIEPAYSAWEADTLPLSYICKCYSLIIHQNFRSVKRKQDIFLKMPCFFVSCSVYEIKIGAAPPIIDPSKVPIMTA